MRKLKLIISYKGTNFCGFQKQVGLRTVQGELETALSSVLNCETAIFGAGRTDAGVHALGQVAHFETESKIPADAFVNILNNVLPQDVSVVSCMEADNTFHARFSAKQKTYEYKMYLSKVRFPLLDEQILQVPFGINIENMQKACEYLVGTKDFACFMASGVKVKDTIRTIYSCNIKQENNIVTFSITGRSFLYNMVRIICGVLLRVGDGTLTPEDVQKIIKNKKRPRTKTLPSRGLTLISVEY